MDLFNFGNFTACCTCSRKDENLSNSEGSSYAKRTSADDRRSRVDKPQLGGVGIVFQGTDDGGLKVSLINPFSLSLCNGNKSPTPPAFAMQTLGASFDVALVICTLPLHFT